MTQVHPRPATQSHVTPHLQVAPITCPTPPLNGDEVFGTMLFEVIIRGTGAATPSLPGWTLRLWPQARLGDATLEARPAGDQDLGALLSGLRAQGITALGPVRQHR